MNIPSIYDESSVVVLEIIETMPWEDDTCTNDDEEILESTNQDVFLIETMRSLYELSQSVTDTLLHSINGILFWILIQQLLLERPALQRRPDLQLRSGPRSLRVLTRMFPRSSTAAC